MLWLSGGYLPRGDPCENVARDPPTEANIAIENNSQLARVSLLAMVVAWLCQQERRIRSINRNDH